MAAWVSQRRLELRGYFMDSCRLTARRGVRVWTDITKRRNRTGPRGVALTKDDTFWNIVGIGGDAAPHDLSENLDMYVAGAPAEANHVR